MNREAQMKLGLTVSDSNPEKEDIWALREQLDALTAQAMDVGKSISGQVLRVDELWNKLTPILYKVEALLSKHCSRRRERRAIELPTWQDWRKKFLSESGLSATARTAQRHLKAYKELIGDEPKRAKNNPGAMSAAERYRQRAALLAAFDMVRAFDEDDDPSEAVARFRAYRIDPNGLLDSLSRCPKPKGFDSLMEDSASFSTEVEQGMILHDERHGASSNKFRIALQPGDWYRLADILGTVYRREFDEVFGSLLPAQHKMATQYFLEALKEAILTINGNGGGPELPNEESNDHNTAQAA